jgi:hypothetical protein
MRINTFVRVTALATFCFLSSCGGGGDSAKSACTTIGSNSDTVFVAGGSDNQSASVDGNLTTFATVRTQAPGSFIGGSGNDFPAGSAAGVFITPPSNFVGADVTLSTFDARSGSSTALETATGAMLAITQTSGDPAALYVSFTTRLAFSGVKMQINNAASAEYLVFEICGTGMAR